MNYGGETRPLLPEVGLMELLMEYRVEGRGPIGRPRRTWLESIDADLAEL